MGHCIEYYDCKESEKKEKEASLAEYVKNECWQEGGHMSPIRWLTHEPLACIDDARSFLEQNDRGWYDCLAVRYKVPLDTKALRDAQKAKAVAFSKYNALQSANYPSTLSSEFISCKNCHSKLNRLALMHPGNRRNTCPVCQADLRPQSMLDRINRALKAAEKAQERTRQAERNAKKQEVRWLIKIEYHQ